MSPFFKYKDWEDCIKRNRSKSNPEAYCGDIKNKTEKTEVATCPGDKIRSKGKGRGLGVGRGQGPIGRIALSELNPVAKSKKIKGGVTEFGGNSKRTDIIEMPTKWEGADYWIKMMTQDSGNISNLVGVTADAYKKNPKLKKLAEKREKMYKKQYGGNYK